MRGNKAGDVNGIDAVSDMSLRALLGGRALVVRGLVLAMAGLVEVIVGDGDEG